MKNKAEKVLRFVDLIAVTTLLSFSASVLAQNKCVDAKGKVTYSGAPCPATSQSKQLNLGKASATNTAQAGDDELSQLKIKEKSLSMTVIGAESDLRMAGNPASKREAESNVLKYRSALQTVQERIFQISDPEGYKRYVEQRRQQRQEERLQAAERSSLEANRRAQEANQRAAEANSRAAAAETVANDAQYRAAQQRPSSNKGEVYMRNGDFSNGSNGTTCFHHGDFMDCN